MGGDNMVEEVKRECWFCKSEENLRNEDLGNRIRVICDDCFDKANAYALHQVQMALPKK
jgi:hypothetical protein